MVYFFGVYLQDPEARARAEITLSSEYDTSNWEEFLRVWHFSVSQSCPDSNITVSTLLPDVTPHYVQHTDFYKKQILTIPFRVYANLAKLQLQLEFLYSAPLDSLIVFSDIDVIVQQDVHKSFSIPFDVALTTHVPTFSLHNTPRGPGREPDVTKDGSIAPYETPGKVNAGVVFCRNTENTRALYSLWVKIAYAFFDVYWREGYRRCLGEGEGEEDYQQLYTGMILQPALGYLLLKERKNLPESLRIAEIPSALWNAGRVSWSSVGPDTPIIHYLLELRQLITEGVVESTAPSWAKNPIRLWREWEGRAQALSKH